MLKTTDRQFGILAILLATALVTGSVAQSATAGSDVAREQESTIHATGTAKVERTPDFVDVEVGVIVEGEKASEAQARASATMEKALAAVRALTLAGQDLKTGNIDLQPKYKRRSSYSSSDEGVDEIIGYTATNMVRVRTTDLKAVARIIDAGLGAGCNRVNYVEFGIKEALAAREEAVKLAAKAANRKAKVLAESLDLRIGRVVNATTTSRQWGWASNRYSNMQAQVAAGDGRNDESGESVEPGKIEVWADVTVTWAVSAKE